MLDLDFTFCGALQESYISTCYGLETLPTIYSVIVYYSTRISKSSFVGFTVLLYIIENKWQ
jgi:hypothetical protein